MNAPRQAQRVVAEAIERRARHLNAKGDQLFEFETYFVLLYEGWRPGVSSSSQLKHLFTQPATAIRNWLSSSAVSHLLQEELVSAARRLHDCADAFAAQLDDTLAPECLDKRAAFLMLRQLVNYDQDKAQQASLGHDMYLDYFLGDSSVSCHRSHLEVDDVTVRVVTLKDPPTQTCAGILDELFNVPCQFIACSEWRRLDSAAMRRDIRAKRRHFHNAKISLVNYLSAETKSEDMLVDDSASATVAQLGHALTAMEVEGHYFGEYSLTLVLFDRDAERVRRGVNAARKAVAAHDGALHEESYNALNAWLAAVPGGADFNVRRMPLLETHYADLSFLSTLDSGEKRSSVTGLDHLAVFETEYQTPYYLQLHVQDVGHTFVSGATGAGKSFVMNFLLLHAQQWDPLTVIFDLGGSYKKLSALVGGSYVHVGLGHGDFTINPWSLPPTPENLHFLASWVRVLIQSGGQFQTTMQDDRIVQEAVGAVYQVDPSLRRLCTLANLLPRGLSQYLAKWVGSGAYASAFDHAVDTLTLSTWQAFDFDAMQEYPEVLGPLLFYVFHRVNTAVHDPQMIGRVKIFGMDEVWRFALDDVILRYLIGALKTWRKSNGTLILATQSTEDIARSSLLPTVLEACPTKLFLANPGLDTDTARRLFRLNHTEAARITKLIPRRQFLLKRPDRAKVLNLHVDDLSYWLYTNTPSDTARAQAVFEQYGVEAGLQVLAGIHPQEPVAC